MPQRPSHRFFVPDLGADDIVELDGPEAHHLLHVLRLQVGEKVQIFDGNGIEATAVIAARMKRAVRLQIVERVIAADTSLPLVLATAVPKGERFRWLVEKATELGVRKLVPLETARSTVDPRDSKLDKLRQTVIAACKQSGRSRLMEITPVIRWTDFLPTECAGRTAYLAQPNAGPFELPAERLRSTEPIVFAIGPEGGFTDEEVASAIHAGVQPVSLGPTILRVETAAVALAGFFAIRHARQCSE